MISLASLEIMFSLKSEAMRHKQNKTNNNLIFVKNKPKNRSFDGLNAQMVRPIVHLVTYCQLNRSFIV